VEAAYLLSWVPGRHLRHFR